MNAADSHLFNAAFIDDLYEAYLADPNEVSPEWRAYFAKVQDEDKNRAEIPHAPVQARFAALAKQSVPAFAMQQSSGIQDSDKVLKQNAVLRLVNYYRVLGHEAARLDPLEQHERPYIADLTLEAHGLSNADLDTVFNTGSFFGFEEAPLRKIIETLESIYCGTIGAEYMHLSDTRKKRWIQERLESAPISLKSGSGFDTECRLQILERLTAAEGLEHYLDRTYVGQKRFSLEGGESLIPLMDNAIQRAGGHGVKEIVIGMAHRGRLNVLVNIMGKSVKDLFSEFEGYVNPELSSGDVKYHQGYSSDVMTPGGPVHLALAFNPSHLEIINPVVEGSVRARQDRRGDMAHNEVLPILIHGDAAFSGQGVVMETLALSQTHGYKTGGTLHLVINNQIGFTTNPFDSRSTQYCTDVAKMVGAPIFHVNGDDPEAVIFIANLALDYRMAFNMDVVIDLVCYRRHGHNEVDEPFVTQPAMYGKIKQHASTPVRYAEHLVKEGVLSAEDAQNMAEQYRAALKARDKVMRRELTEFPYSVDWKPYLNTHWTDSTSTRISAEDYKRLGIKLSEYPEGFKLHRTVERLMSNRLSMANNEMPTDWGFAEGLAYARLIDAGFPIRLSGQDCGRGTFAHRHAVLHDQETGEKYIPLQNIKPDQSRFLVINSLLSEEAVLGFEFGYASSDPESLVIWEAQFGDFANGAQVVFDQFLSSSDAKWRRMCGLAVFLPHGYDGQGPEHSSARLERYLQLCAENNMQVCVPSTPAQFFHMICRQSMRPYRKPLIVMTPKSLLRDKRSTSPIEDFTDNEYRLIIDDAQIQEPKKVKRVLLCAGQVYFKLVDERASRGMDEDVAIVRIEQLYPFPRVDINHLIDRYGADKQWFWVQEEPRNQGAWRFLSARMPKEIDIRYAGRLSSASPAVGYMKIHQQQLEELLNQSFDLEYEG